MNNLDILKKLEKEIVLSFNSQIFINNKPILSGYLFQDFDDNGYQKKEAILNELQNLIYSLYYCKSFNYSGKYETFVQVFLDVGSYFSLKKNKYTIDFIGNSKEIIVSNKFERLLVKPGGYYLYNQAQLLLNTKVMVTKIRFHIDLSLNFAYFSNHNFTTDIFIKETRLYINFLSAGIKNTLPVFLIKILKSKVNFKLKTCVERNDVFRPDNTVLYIDNRDFLVVKNLLLDTINEKEIHLGSDIPLFTKKLADGISWAESPYNKNESFGMNRSKLVATYIYEKDIYNVALEEFLIKNNVDIDTLHLF